jgi:hypothetical protein
VLEKGRESVLSGGMVSLIDKQAKEEASVDEKIEKLQNLLKLAKLTK